MDLRTVRCGQIKCCISAIDSRRNFQSIEVRAHLVTIVGSLICRASHVIENSNWPSAIIIIVSTLKHSVYVQISRHDKYLRFQVFINFSSWLSSFEFLITLIAGHIINRLYIVGNLKPFSSHSILFNPGSLSIFFKLLSVFREFDHFYESAFWYLYNIYHSISPAKLFHQD